MAIPISLQRYKSSGVYLLEFDKSQTIQSSSNVIRLVIGFSKKGPFNVPTFVQDREFFIDVFGNIDGALERRGSFFHRSCLTALERGPILALNLLRTDDTLDVTDFRPMSLNASEVNGSIDDAPLSKYFNRDKFWYYDPKQLPKIVEDYHITLDESLFTIANVGRKPLSVAIRKSDKTTIAQLGLDILAKEWYGTGNVPSWMNENDFISDYLIDVFVFEGDFDDYNALKIDPVFGRFFDSKGLLKNITDGFGNVKNGLDEFANSGLVPVIGRFTGVMIPDFIDKNGENLFIEDIVNREIFRTGLMMYFDKNKFDDEYLSANEIDLIGHTIESEEPAILDYLSYYGSIVENMDYTESASFPEETFELIAEGSTIIPNTVNGYLKASTALTTLSTYAADRYDTLSLLGPNHPDVLASDATSFWTTQTEFEEYYNKLSIDKAFINLVSAELNSLSPSFVADKSHVVEILAFSDNNTSPIIDRIDIRFSLEDEITGGIRTSLDQYYYWGAAINTAVNVPVIEKFDVLLRSTSLPNVLYSGQWNAVYQDVLSGILTDGDEVLTNIVGPTHEPVTFTYSVGNSFASLGVIDGNNFSKNIGLITVASWTDNTFTTQTNIPTVASTGYASRQFKTIAGSLNESLTIDSQPNPNEIVLDNSSSGPAGLNGFNGKIKVGDYLVMSFVSGTTKIDPVTNKSRLTRVLSVSEDKDPLSLTYKMITVKTTDPIWADNSRVERYKLVEDFVSNYRFTVLQGYSLRPEHLPDGTLDRMNDILDVMYDTNIATALADKENISFRYIVDTFNSGIEGSSKARLSRLAKNRENAFAILNMPSIEEFKNSTNPFYKFTPQSDFDPIYIADGGNLDLNPTNVMTLPSIEDGANYCGFYGPNLLIRENGKTISVPPAAHVSNLFVEKYTRAQPYSIVAGTRRGVVAGSGVVGVEYAFTREHLEAIEPWGYNAILNIRGSGLVINANQTAQQNIKSALSSIHVREVLIFIQDGVRDILKNYRWEFNTASIRLEIKTIVDNFLSSVRNNGGLYNFETVMDSSNNTPELIDAEKGIIDIFVEPVRGFAQLWARYTVLRTGSIDAGAFQIPS